MSSADVDLRLNKMIFQQSCLVATQVFSNALVQSEVSALIMELHGNDLTQYAAFAARQASMEKTADFFLIAAACALSDRFGRKPLQTISGGLFGFAWNAFCSVIPATLSNTSASTAV